MLIKPKSHASVLLATINIFSVNFRFQLKYVMFDILGFQKLWVLKIHKSPLFLLNEYCKIYCIIISSLFWYMSKDEAVNVLRIALLSKNVEHYKT